MNTVVTLGQQWESLALPERPELSRALDKKLYLAIRDSIQSRIDDKDRNGDSLKNASEMVEFSIKYLDTVAKHDRPSLAHYEQNMYAFNGRMTITWLLDSDPEIGPDAATNRLGMILVVLRFGGRGCSKLPDSLKSAARDALSLVNYWIESSR
jgi:hypothetical protein